MKCLNYKCNIEFEKEHKNHNFCCIGCRRRQYYQDNIVAMKAQHKADRIKHLDRFMARDKRYRESNREKLRLRSLVYEIENREKRRLKSKKYHKTHKEHGKAYAVEYYQNNKKTLCLQSKLFSRYNLSVPMKEIESDYSKYEAMCL